MSPTQKERTQTAREDILAAAKEAFVDKGFRNTTIRDISKLSGRSIGCIYHHFDSKEGIISELLTSEYFFRQWQGLISMFISEDLPENLEEMAWEIKKEVEKNVDSLQLILWDAVEFKGAYFQRFVDQHESLLNVVIDAVGSKLQSRGYFSSVDPRVAIYVILNTFFDMFGRRTLFGIEVIEGMDDEELVNQVSELFTKGVFGT